MTDTTWICMADRQPRVGELVQCVCVFFRYVPGSGDFAATLVPDHVTTQTKRYLGRGLCHTVQGWRYSHRWSTTGNQTESHAWVTHWMPLAERPDEREIHREALRQLHAHQAAERTTPLSEPMTQRGYEAAMSALDAGLEVSP